MHRSISCFIALFYSLGLIGQSVPDTLPVSEFIQEFARLCAADEDEAKAYANEIMPAYEKYWEDQVIKNYGLLVQEANSQLGTDHRLIARIYYRMGRYLYIQREYVNSINYLSRAVQQWEKSLPPTHLNLASTHYLAGMAFNQTEQYPEAIVQFRKAYEGYAESDDNAFWSVECYRLMGQAYKNNGDYPTAITTYEVALQRYRQLEINNQRQIGDLYADLAVAYSRLKDRKSLQKAILLSQQAIQYYQETGRYQSRIAGCRLNMGNYYEDLEQSKPALQEYRTALAYYQEEENDAMISDILENMGIVYLNLSHYDSATYLFREALQYIETEAYSTDLNSLYHNLGHVFYRNNQLDSAAFYIQNAIQRIVYNFIPENLEENPITSAIDLIGAKHNLLEDLDLKARIWNNRFRQTGQQEDLETSLQTYQAAVELIDQMRTDFSGNESQLFWLDESYDLFERAILQAYLLHERTQQKIYLNMVFQFMERNKGILILQNWRQDQAAVSLAIPDSLLRQQKQLADLVVELNRRRVELENADAADSLRQACYQEWLLAKEQKTAFDERLKRHFPSLGQLTAAVSYQELETVATSLSSDQLLVEYFTGDSSLFMLTITKGKTQLLRRELHQLQEMYQPFIRALTAPGYIRNYEPQAVFDTFTNYSYQLYQLLLEPAMGSKAYSKLTIIPDGFLNTLPFDILLTKPLENTNAFSYAPSHLSYLLKETSVQYAYSWSLLEQQRQIQAGKTQYSFVGFAPSFQGPELFYASRACTADELAKLEFNETEIKKIQQLTKGRIFTGSEANKQQFLSLAAQSSILHLSTHACIDPLQPSQSRIFFTDDYLLLNELQQLNLRSELVVLSACETGLGTYFRGEGSMSLAHSFVYSGSPSVVMSLWSVNDEATSQLMQFFYEGLASGQEKSEALRNAKIRYLEQASRQKMYPYYWAAFLSLGKDAPVLTSGAPSYLIIGFAGAGLLLGFLARYWWKRK